MNVEGSPPLSPIPAIPPTSIYLWGEERREVNFMARLLCREMDPQFRWVEADSAPGTGVAARPVDHQGLVLTAQKLVPNAGGRPELMWSFLRPHDQRRAGFDVNEFLRLPDPVQVAVGALLGRDSPRVLAVADLDLFGEFDPIGTGLYGQFIEWLNSHEITLVATATGEPQLEGIDFEYSISVRRRGAGAQASSVAVCQWGDCPNCRVRNLLSGGPFVCPNAETLEWRGCAPVPRAHASH